MKERNDKLLGEAVNALLTSSKRFIEAQAHGSVDIRINFNKNGITNFNKTEYETYILESHQ